ncbi:MAG: ArsR family transcriptional regulator [Thermoplasmata archaeon]|nr:ArsR family transcriptional regulator [Thermoplasmata archaeon]
MKDCKVIRSSDAFQLLADETRLKMIYLLRAKEMTVSQIAGELGLTPQTIYHHIKRLREAEMIDVAREERVDHLVESYYRATAGQFHFVNGGCAKERWSKNEAEKSLLALRSLGFEVDVSPATASDVLKMREALHQKREISEIVAKVYDMDDIDPLYHDDLIEFAMMMKMNDEEFEECLDAQRALRERLLRKGKSQG